MIFEIFDKLINQFLYVYVSMQPICSQYADHIKWEQIPSTCQIKFLTYCRGIMRFIVFLIQLSLSFKKKCLIQVI